MDKSEELKKLEKTRKLVKNISFFFVVPGFIILFLSIALEQKILIYIFLPFEIISLVVFEAIDKYYRKKIRKAGGNPDVTKSKEVSSDGEYQNMVDEVRNTPIDSRQDDSDDYRVCPYCNTKNDRDATFCKNCGKKIR